MNVLSYEEARSSILGRLSALDAEEVDLLDALGRVLAEDVIAPWPLPSFDNSAMDGYAVRAAECAGDSSLPVAGRILAGSTELQALAPGTALRIMTGAMIPAGCDSVVPFEDAEEREGRVRVLAPVKLHQHIRRAGEDVGAGEHIVTAGRVLRPAEINMLASCGQRLARVVRRPSVAIVSTGDELVELGSTPRLGQLVNSNLYGLAAAVREAGAVPILGGIARDTVESHRQRLSEGMKADVLVTSAGVSVGDRDLVRETLTALGVELIFWRVRVKPGKALAFGMRHGRPVFALPGNPVSAMLTFEEFVAPALRKLMGHSRPVKPLLMATLQHELKKKPGQTHLVRLRLEHSGGRLLASSAGRQETGIIRTMLTANALAVLPAERESFAAGEAVPVHLLDTHLESL